MIFEIFSTISGSNSAYKGKQTILFDMLSEIGIFSPFRYFTVFSEW